MITLSSCLSLFSTGGIFVHCPITEAWVRPDNSMYTNKFYYYKYYFLIKTGIWELIRCRTNVGSIVLLISAPFFFFCFCLSKHVNQNVSLRVDYRSRSNVCKSHVATCHANHRRKLARKASFCLRWNSSRVRWPTLPSCHAAGAWCRISAASHPERSRSQPKRNN